MLSALLAVLMMKELVPPLVVAAAVPEVADMV
jgi:hypothetical protein